MLSEEQFNKVKKYLKQGRKQYAIADALGIKSKQITVAKRYAEYQDYFARPMHRVPKQVEIPFEDITPADLMVKLNNLETMMKEIIHYTSAKNAGQE